ncbi:hypothetical protein KUTeg_024915, partial [Tegillarca granosa]
MDGAKEEISDDMGVKSNMFKTIEFEEMYRKEDADKKPIVQRIRSSARKICTKKWWKRSLFANIPIIKNLKNYKIKEDLPSDIISGMTVGIMQIPQGMAYALLASLPPICGLYMSFFAPLIYFFLGTSRHASMGTIAIVSLMIASVLDTALGPEDKGVTNNNLTVSIVTMASSNVTSNPISNTTLSSGNPVTSSSGGESQFTEREQQKIALATALSFLSGLIMIFLGKCRMGVIATYMSEPMVSGFTSAVAIHVTISQAKHILGITGVPRFNGVFKAVRTVIGLFQNITTFNVATFLISVICIIVILPHPDIPNPGLVLPYIKDAIIIGVVAFTQSVSMSKILARKDNYSINPSQEMVAYGAGSVLASIFSGYIPAASVARSMVQYGAGGKSQIAALFGCLVVLVVIMAIGPLFYSLPKCVLSAVILVNLRGMFLQFLELPSLWKKSKYDFSIWIVTHLCTVILDADIGIAIDVLKRKDKYKKTHESKYARIVEFQSPVYFANSEIFVKAVYRDTAIHPDRVRKERKRNGKATDVEYKVTVDSGKSENGEVEKGLMKPCLEPSSIIGDVKAVVLDFKGVIFVDVVGVKAVRQVFTDYENIGLNKRQYG